MSHTTKILICVVVFVLLILIIRMMRDNENFQRLGGPPLAYACEFRRECLEDNNRSIALTNGMEGVCTMDGLACPSFLLDQNLSYGDSLTPEEYHDLLLSK